MKSSPSILIILLVNLYKSKALLNVFYNGYNDSRITFWHDYTQHLFCELKNLDWLAKPNHYAIISSSWNFDQGKININMKLK